MTLERRQMTLGCLIMATAITPAKLFAMRLCFQHHQIRPTFPRPHIQDFADFEKRWAGQLPIHVDELHVEMLLRFHLDGQRLRGGVGVRLHLDGLVYAQR